MKYGVNKLACRTGVILLRFSGERGQARGEREVRDTRPSHLVCLALRTSRSPRACPRSPEKRKKKITPVLQARNVPGRYIVGGCVAFPYVQKSVFLYAIPSPDR